MLPAHECRPPLHPCVHLSDDSRCPRPIRWNPKCHFPPSASIPIPVKSWHFLSSYPFLILSSRWLSLITVVAGVSLVGFSGSLIKDAVKEVVVGNLIPVLRSSSEPIEKPEATRVLIGELCVRDLV